MANRLWDEFFDPENEVERDELVERIAALPECGGIAVRSDSTPAIVVYGRDGISAQVLEMLLPVYFSRGICEIPRAVASCPPLLPKTKTALCRPEFKEAMRRRQISSGWRNIKGAVRLWMFGTSKRSTTLLTEFDDRLSFREIATAHPQQAPSTVVVIDAEANRIEPQLLPLDKLP